MPVLIIFCNFAACIYQSATNKMKSFDRYMAFFCMAGAIASSSCSNKSDDPRPVIAVSIEPQRNILNRLAGDRFNIVTVISKNESPETFEPSPSRRMEIENADLYFTTGLFVFEENLKLATDDESKFVNTSAGIDLIYEKSHGDNHSMFLPNIPAGTKEIEADPHVWLSVKNMRRIAANMTDHLVHIDPEHASEYKTSFKKMCSHLDSLDNAFTTRIAEAGSPAFMLWHPSMGYFARDYGLKMITMGHENKEVSATSLKVLIDSAKNANARIFLFQNLIDSRQAESISAGTGAHLVTFDPLAYDWESELSKVVDELSRQ